MIKNRYVVLMTATLNPGEYGNQSSRASVQDREADYGSALDFWLSLGDPRVTGICFCENSGADLTSLKKVAEKYLMSVEFLSFYGNEKPRGVHYGYSELGLIDYAIKNSNSIRSSRYFIKATGRLKFPIICDLLDRLDVEFDYAIDHRRKYLREVGHRTRARTQLMLFNTKFYKNNLLSTRDEMLGKGVSHIEEFIPIKIEQLKSQTKEVVGVNRFPVECYVEGIARASALGYHCAVHG